MVFADKLSVLPFEFTVGDVVQNSEHGIRIGLIGTEVTLLDPEPFGLVKTKYRRDLLEEFKRRSKSFSYSEHKNRG